MDELNIGQLLNQRYEVLQFIGRGGMADVYRVFDHKRQVDLALKQMHSGLANDRVFLRRFEKEAEALQRLQHPHIVRYYGLEHDEIDPSHVFMLMEFIDGASLDAEIARTPQGISLKRTIEVIVPVCQALQYAHGEGIVHCDFKPANVLLSKKGDVFLSDFGIARMVESSGTTGTMALRAGSPGYMAPEQVRGERPTRQTDIYALGVLLFEMLTGGERPFTGERAAAQGIDTQQVFWEQTYLPPLELKQFRPDLPEVWLSTVMRCLEKEPEQRWGSAMEMLNQLRGSERAAGPAVRPAGRTPTVFPPSVPDSSTALHEAPLPSVRAAPAIATPAPKAGALPREAPQANPVIKRRRRIFWMIVGGLMLLFVLLPLLSFIVILMNPAAATAPTAAPTTARTIVPTIAPTKGVSVVETKIVIVTATSAVKTATVTATVTATKNVEVQHTAFNTPHPILSDLRVRQAMAYCTNKLELIQSVYPFIGAEAQQGLILNSFIGSTHWAYAGDRNLTIYPFNKDMGIAILESAGWTLNKATGLRANAAGSPLSLKLTTTDAVFRQTWAAVWQKQMKACGIEIVRLHVPSTWLFGETTGLARRDFEMAAFAWIGTDDPGGESVYACDQIPYPDNDWAGQNDTGWCNQKASTAVKLANSTLVQKDRSAQYLIVQQEYTKDVPVIPLFNRTKPYAYNPRLTGFYQVPGNQIWNWNVETWAIPGRTTLILGMTSEPTTLYPLVDGSMATRLAYMPVSGSATATANYAYTANLYYRQLPTIENGGARNNDVDVKEGDPVIDINSDAVVLKAGIWVRDSTGAVVEYKAGSTIKMKQLVITFELAPGIKWSDGRSLVKADLQLGYTHDCDPDSGAASYYLCNSTARYEVISDTQMVLTYKPGFMDTLYYLPPFGWYPSQRLIASGAYQSRKLADVPAKDWANLKEISENPIGTGPYMINGWYKGQSISYIANPYFYKGKPKTSQIMIKFLDPANAESQIIAGQVDILGDDTLNYVSETLQKAEKAGSVKLLIVPYETWEHIDFSLFVK